MQFTLGFNSSGISLIRKKDEAQIIIPGGLFLVDLARRATGCSNLDVARISTFVNIPTFLAANIKLNEAEARASGAYNYVNHVQVVVDPGSLNKYLYIKSSIKKDEITGEILEVEWSFMLNEIALIGDWIDSGSPHHWDVEDKEIPSDYFMRS